jgi:hypothetical protein
VNSWVCGFRWPRRIALALSSPLRRKTFSPSPMLVSRMEPLYQYEDHAPVTSQQKIVPGGTGLGGGSL